jgi:hypothetical protein
MRRFFAAKSPICCRCSAKSLDPITMQRPVQFPADPAPASVLGNLPASIAPAAHCLSYSGAAANIPAINNMKPTPNKKSSGAIGDIFHIDEAATEARGLTEHWSLADCH